MYSHSSRLDRAIFSYEGHIRNDISASGNGLLARLAVPDSDRVASNSGLSAERADVSCVLCDFHLLDLLTERGTITDTVFTNNSDFLSTLCLMINEID